MIILFELSTIAPYQANPTEATTERVCQLLDYMTTNPEAVIRDYTSDMILNVQSNASYLLAGKGHSHAVGCFILGSLQTT